MSITCNNSFEQLYARNVFDAVMISAYAIHDYLEDGNDLSTPRYDQDVCLEGAIEPWTDGQRLAEYIAKVECMINKYSGNAKACKALVSMYVHVYEFRGSVPKNQVNKVLHDKYILISKSTSRGTL